MSLIKPLLICSLLVFKTSLFAQYDCLFYPAIQNVISINNSSFDSIQIVRVEQKVKLLAGDKPVWIGLKTTSPISEAEIDSTLTKIKREYNGDSAVFINKSYHWQTLVPTDLEFLIDSTFYCTSIPNSCWGGVRCVNSKNKIKRNKLDLIRKVKSDEFICYYTYDDTDRVITARIKYRRGVQIYEGAIHSAEFIYDTNGNMIAIKTKDYDSKTYQLDYFTITYF